MSSKVPHALDAEKSVLGAILLDSQTAPNIFDEIAESDFYLQAHQLIFRAMKDLYNERK